MKYMLLLYSNPSEAPQFTPEEQQAGSLLNWMDTPILGLG